jgi:CheY-like chemotaxis protein
VPAAVGCVLTALHLRCADATRAFRAWEQEHRPGLRLPIYCLTANVLDEHRQECEAAGMDFHLPKPLRVHALAELRQRALAYAEQLGDEAPPA